VGGRWGDGNGIEVGRGRGVVGLRVRTKSDGKHANTAHQLVLFLRDSAVAYSIGSALVLL